MNAMTLLQVVIHEISNTRTHLIRTGSQSDQMGTESRKPTNCSSRKLVQPRYVHEVHHGCQTPDCDNGAGFKKQLGQQFKPEFCRYTELIRLCFQHKWIASLGAVSTVLCTPLQEKFNVSSDVSHTHPPPKWGRTEAPAMK